MLLSCTMTYFSLEHISRRTKNHQVVVMDRIGYDYCLFMLQHLGEFQEKYNLPTGDYDKFWEIHRSWFARDLLDYRLA